MHTHKCVKCGVAYQDQDPEPYYCPPCNDERKKLATEIDKKMAGRVSTKPRSLLQEYDAMPKVNGFMIYKP